MSSQLSLLGKRRFLPFFLTQFLGAFNDNVYKNAVIMLIVFQLASANSAIYVNLAAALFVLPFFLFSAIAGQLADKFDKAMLMQRCKLAEIPIMLLGSLGFYLQSPELLIAVLFLMGTQSTFFGPAKYGILPQHLKDDELIGGNGLVEMGTFLAILLGTMAGAYFINQQGGALYVSLAVVILASLGYVTSRFIPKAAAANEGLSLSFNVFSQTKALFTLLNKERESVGKSVLGISWFWFLGAVYLTQIPAFAQSLGGDESVVTTLLACFSIGIAVGSLVCEKLSRKQVELGLVPLGSLGLSVFGVMLWHSALGFDAAVSITFSHLFNEAAGLYLLSAIFFIGFFGGLYTVPLYALIQSRSQEKVRSRVIAANNVMNALFMVGSAIFAMALLSFGLSVNELFLSLAIINVLVALYIYRKVPEFVIRFVLWVITHTIYRVRHHNIDNLPSEGATVIVANHVSFLDALIIAGAFKRPVRYVMYEPIYRIPVLNAFFRAVGAIPIDSKKHNPEVYHAAFAKIKTYLAEGEVVCIFPEGKLTADGEIDTFMPGIERILKDSPVPVLPVAIQGMWGSMFSRKRAVRLPRPTWSKVHIKVGDLQSGNEVDCQSLQHTVTRLRGQYQ